MFVGLGPQGNAAADEQPRFITLTPDEVAAVQDYQSRFGAASRGNVFGGLELMREVRICGLSSRRKLPWEVNGQGEFTQAWPLDVLAKGMGLHDKRPVPKPP